MLATGVVITVAAGAGVRGSRGFIGSRRFIAAPSVNANGQAASKRQKRAGVLREFGSRSKNASDRMNVFLKFSAAQEKHFRSDTPI
jgi:hypothetical protein